MHGPQSTRSQPQPTLQTRDGIALTVGIVLGVGIFKTPSLVAAGVAEPVTLIALWVAGGIIALIGALCYAEMASAYPDAGGDYAWLRRAYGQRFAFLYAWARISVIQTGSIALLAFVVGDYVSELAPIGAYSSAIYAAGVVILLTLTNWLGIRKGAATQNGLTLLELLGLTVLILAGLLIAPGAAPAPVTAATNGSSLGLVMVFVLLAYGGWNEAVYISSELRGDKRRMARVMAIGIGIITLLYVLANLAYLRALGLPAMADSQAVGADVMRAAFGNTGAVAIAIIVAVAALTSANATIITGARSAWAAGRDIPALAPLGVWDEARATPTNALLVQGAIALAIVIGGAFARDGFQLAVEYTAPVFWFFFLAVGIALFILRRREPTRERPYRVPLYPVLPALFCIANAYLLWSSLAYTGVGALVGVALLGIGAVLSFTVFQPSPSPKESVI
ncbi:MAG: APC family permease [Sphingorhabdus sp.]